MEQGCGFYSIEVTVNRGTQKQIIPPGEFTDRCIGSHKDRALGRDVGIGSQGICRLTVADNGHHFFLDEKLIGQTNPVFIVAIITDQQLQQATVDSTLKIDLLHSLQGTVPDVLTRGPARSAESNRQTDFDRLFLPGAGDKQEDSQRQQDQGQSEDLPFHS